MDVPIRIKVEPCNVYIGTQPFHLERLVAQQYTLCYDGGQSAFVRAEGWTQWVRVSGRGLQYSVVEFERLLGILGQLEVNPAWPIILWAEPPHMCVSA
jgi:hypothetical protein